MDEPTSALWTRSLRQRSKILRMELKKDYTIIMVTHNMQQAARISDKTAFFLLGEMVEFDKTENTFLHAEGQADGRLYNREVWLICVHDLMNNWSSSTYC